VDVASFANELVRAVLLPLPLSHQRPLDALGLLLRQTGLRIGPDQCGPLSLSIVNHPAFAALTYQESRRRKLLVGHLLRL